MIVANLDGDNVFTRSSMWRKTQKETIKDATQKLRPRHHDARGWSIKHTCDIKRGMCHVGVIFEAQIKMSVPRHLPSPRVYSPILIPRS